MSLYLTFDLDWAPDYVLEDLRTLLAEVGLPATFFCTHDSPAVERLRLLPRCETALHPNLRNVADELKTLTALHALFPKARGVRNHYLYYHSGLLDHLHRLRMLYFSNDLLFLQPQLAPYYDWSGMVRLPIYWEDDVHCQFYRHDFSLGSLKLEQPGLKVFSFHPVHIWLNTRSLADYQQAKPVLRDPAQAAPHRQQGVGIRTLLGELFAFLRGKRVGTLSQLARHFCASERFGGRFSSAISRGGQ